MMIVIEDADISDAAKENDAKEAVKPSKVRAMAAAVNFNNSNSGKSWKNLILKFLFGFCTFRIVSFKGS